MTSFWQYITRPSGFGRTQWGLWACMVGIMLYGCVLVFIDFDPVVASIVGFCFLLTTLIFWIGTYKNWKTDRAGLPHHPNNHDDKLWDGSPYLCCHGIKPDSKTLKCAWPYAHDLKAFPQEPTAEERAEKVYPKIP